MKLEQEVARPLATYEVAILKVLGSLTEDKITVKNLVEKLKEIAPRQWNFSEKVPRHLENDLFGLNNKGFISYEGGTGQPLKELKDIENLNEEQRYVRLAALGVVLVSYLK